MKQTAMLDPARCCVRACPAGLLRLGAQQVTLLSGCLGCGACAAACPFDAIFLADSGGRK